MTRWQHDETGRISTSDKQPSERWYRIYGGTPQFEEWARSKELSLVQNSYTSEFDYLDIETQMFWECWQAATKNCCEHGFNGICHTCDAIMTPPAGWMGNINGLGTDPDVP